MSKSGLVAVLGATFLTASVVAARQDGGPGPRGPRGPHFDVAQMQSELGLSDDQVAQLQKLRTDNRSQAIRQRADLRIARGELNDLLRAAVVDEKAVAAKVKQVTDLEAAATRARVEHRLALRRILTPEQASKMESLMRQHVREGFRGRRGFKGPRPDGAGGPAGPGPDGGENR